MTPMTNRTEVNAVKTRKIFALALVIALFCLTACSSAFGAADSEEKAKLLDMVGEYQSPSNNYQKYADIWMGSVDGKLYFYIFRPESWRDHFGSYLCSVDSDGIHKIAALRMDDSVSVDIRYLEDGFLYYYLNDNNFSEDAKLMCYDFHNREEPITLLYQTPFQGLHAYHSSADSSIYLSVSDKEDYHTSFLQVEGNRVMSSSDEPETHVLGDKKILLDIDYENSGRIMVSQADGEPQQIPLGYAKMRMLIPTEHGLLLHNYGQDDMLYYFDENGDMVQLFQAPCSFSESAAAVYKNRVYLSFMRYEKGHQGGLGGWDRYENDTLIGTYVISLEDYSVRKLSDRIYSGLYIFDDSGTATYTS